MTGQHLYINRYQQCLDGPTLGELLVPEKRLDQKWILRKFATLEPRWDGNAVGKSCIPDGTYKLFRRSFGIYFRKYKKDHGHAFVLEIENVPGRTAVLLHKGNWERNSKGCCLIGYPDDRKAKGDEPMILNSTRAYTRFYDLAKALYQVHSELHVSVRTQGALKCLV